MTRVWAAGLAAAASVSLMSVGGRAVDPPATPATTNTQPVAPYRTANFVILAPTSEVARAIGEAAEAQRAAVARRWFGDDPAPWPRPCTIRVDLALGPSGGSTTYEFTPGSDGHPAVGFAS
ncbi:MAG TPA: hypothetical protein VKE74_34450, partial [Gemmataceae bacterium]|nr:hypothetical protein [Gemmataceae bacterium]